MASASEAPTSDQISAVIAFSLWESWCGSLQLKPEQLRALCTIVNGNDTIVVLPTGYGKSLVYLLLPFVTLHLRRSRGVSADQQHSIILVIEPLSSLLEDQVQRATSMNLRPTNLPYHRAFHSCTCLWYALNSLWGFVCTHCICCLHFIIEVLHPKVTWKIVALSTPSTAKLGPNHLVSFLWTENCMYLWNEVNSSKGIFWMTWRNKWAVSSSVYSLRLPLGIHYNVWKH